VAEANLSKDFAQPQSLLGVGLNQFEFWFMAPGCELAASQAQTLPIAKDDDRAPSKR